MWGCLLVSQPSLSAQPTQEPISVSYAELLLGNAEEFGVWPWTGSLCANHHFKFLWLPGAVHINHLREIFPKQHRDSHHAITKKFNKNLIHINQKIENNNNGKISFFGQGQPVHFDYLSSLVPHYFIFYRSLALFTRWLLDFWRFPSRFLMLKVYTALSAHSSNVLFKSTASILFLLRLC